MATSTSPFYSEAGDHFHWNWGGFWDPLGFGFAHRAYKTYLFLLPGLVPVILAVLCYMGILAPKWPVFASLPLFLIWNIGCAAKGEKIAWAVEPYTDGVAFRAVMDSWNRAGWMHFVIRLAFWLIIALVAGVTWILFWEPIMAWVAGIWVVA